MDDISAWGSVIGAAIADTRERAGLSAVKLAAKTKEIGHPIHRVALSKIEAGTREVTITELSVIAAALGISPLGLLFPQVLDYIEVLPDKAMPGREALEWFIGTGLSAPEGVAVNEALNQPIQIAQQLVAVMSAIDVQRNAVFQASSGAELLTMPISVREHLTREAERSQQSIEKLESQYDRLVRTYRTLTDA